MSESPRLDRWKKAAEVYALVVTPVIVALIGSCYATSASTRERDARMVELAVSVLRSEPTDSTREIRRWATKALSKYSGVPFSPEAQVQLDSFRLPGVEYRASGGTISPTGNYTAPSEPGTYRVIATMRGGRFADTALVTVLPRPAPAKAIALFPDSTLLRPGDLQHFVPVLILTDGTTDRASVVFSSTGGTISANGFYRAGSTPGSYHVIARQSGGDLADTSVVVVRR